MDKLSVRNLSFSYGKGALLKNISLGVPEGGFVGIVGPNGSGKSTLLKNICGIYRPRCGEVRIDGRPVARMSSKALAREMAVVGQEHVVPFNYTVEEIVMMGRTPYKRLLEPDSAADYQAVETAMAAAGVAQLRKRDFAELSGGEKQRVLIARAFAQETDLIIMDEPTNHLDIAYQLQIFELLKRSNKTVLAAIHDLNMALTYCDALYILADGEIAREGPAEEVLTEANIREYFHVGCAVERSAIHPRGTIAFYTRADGGRL